MSFPISQKDITDKPIPSHNLFGYDSLIRNGHDVEWVCPQTHLSKPEKALCKILGADFAKLLIQLKCIFLATKFDMIYSGHDMHLIILGLLRFLRICRKPVFVLCHFSYNLNFVKSPKSKCFKYIERSIVFSGVDKLVFANELLYKLAAATFKVPQKHSGWVNWGADISFFDNFSAADLQFEEPEDSNPPFFAAVGTANRDYTTLVSAFNKLPMLHLKVFGRLGETVSSDKGANIKFYNLSRYGNMAMKHLSYYYLNSTAVLIPILHENDVPNGATVLLEALAAGKPVVITDFATNYIDVEKEGVGLKVKAGDISGWIDAITYLNNNPDVVRKMGVKARQLANEKYNYSIFANNLINEIDSFYQTQKSKL